MHVIVDVRNHSTYYSKVHYVVGPKTYVNHAMYI